MSDRPSEESMDTEPSYNGAEPENNGRTKSKRSVSGFKIMTVARGFTEEADKLLDYLVCTICPTSFISSQFMFEGGDIRSIAKAIFAEFYLRYIPGALFLQRHPYPSITLTG
jgi:hypothetical protein